LSYIGPEFLQIRLLEASIGQPAVPRFFAGRPRLM